MDRADLIKRLGEVLKNIKKSGGVVTLEEVDNYFSDFNLDDEHKKLVYAYLDENDVYIDGLYDEKSNMPEDNETVYNTVSGFLQMYLEDISAIPPIDKEEGEFLYIRLIEGDEDAKKRLSEGLLHKVVEYAKEYIESSGQITIEELIEEGNIGLIIGINSLFGSKKKIDAEEYLAESVKYSIESFIDETMQNTDSENTLLAKTTLLHEASKYLAGEFGRIATIEELSDYTKMEEEEIRNILRLSPNTIKIGSGDIDYKGGLQS